MPLEIAVILGSTRPGRRGDQIAPWVLDTARAHGGAEYHGVDLTDYGLRNLDEPGNPNPQHYEHEHTSVWGRLIGGLNG